MDSALPGKSKFSEAQIAARAQRICDARGGGLVEDQDRRRAIAELEALDIVDEASVESFPASDPPAWIGHQHPLPGEEPADEDV